MLTPFFKLPAVIVKPGRVLAEEVKKGLSPTSAALLARDLVIGDVFYCDPTPKQACGLTGASSGYLHTLLRASAEEIEQIRRRTLSLSSVHNRKTPKTDAAIDRFIAEVGRDRVLKALGLTTPATNGNAGHDHANDNATSQMACQL